jgi:hypothetical protein
MGRRAQYWKGEKGRVSIKNFKTAKFSTRYLPSRLCGPLDDLEKHIASNVQRHHAGKCAVCGRSTYWKCGLCNKRICLGAGGRGCQIALHNDSMFGLARCAFLEVLGWKMKEWKASNEAAKRQNMQRINKLWGLLMKEDEGDD